VSAETIAGVIAHGSVLASLAANGCADDELWPLLHARAGGAAPAPGALRTLSMVRCKALRTLTLAACAGLGGGEDGGRWEELDALSALRRLDLSYTPVEVCAAWPCKLAWMAGCPWIERCHCLCQPPSQAKQCLESAAR
jgi:hypothetical protein